MFHGKKVNILLPPGTTH